MYHYFSRTIILMLLPATVLVAGCKDGVNLFNVEDDIELGQQLEQEILNNPQEYPVMPRAQHPEAYAYLDAMVNDVLNSGEVIYRDEFEWNVYLIDQDVLNAFCAPGGYIFVYSGLVNYLDRPSALAGVIGHEIAHADQRHSTEQMTKVYGLQTLLSLVTGKEDPGMIAQIATGLASLKFSRNNETEADDWSVRYLCPTDYDGAGAAQFFQKLEDEGNASPPEFLSTHPSPDNRVENITAQATDRGCSGPDDSTEEIQAYQAFQALMP